MRRTLAVPVDNGVLGEPEIECGSHDVTVNFNTINDFEGHVYVKVRNYFFETSVKCTFSPKIL